MSEAVLGPKSAKYRVFCGYTWKTPVYLENTWVSCRFPQFCPRFCPRPALRLRETREFPEGNSRETEWSTKHPLVSLETSGNAKCWGPSGFPLGCRKPSYRPSRGPATVSSSLSDSVAITDGDPVPDSPGEDGGIGSHPLPPPGGRARSPWSTSRARTRGLSIVLGSPPPSASSPSGSGRRGPPCRRSR